MAIDKYVCPTFGEEIEPEKLIKRILYSRHSQGCERKFFGGLLGVINEFSFYPDWGKDWEVLRYDGYMLLPYHKQLLLYYL